MGCCGSSPAPARPAQESALRPPPAATPNRTSQPPPPPKEPPRPTAPNLTQAEFVYPLAPSAPTESFLARDTPQRPERDTPTSPVPPPVPSAKDDEGSRANGNGHGTQPSLEEEVQEAPQLAEEKLATVPSTLLVSKRHELSPPRCGYKPESVYFEPEDCADPDEAHSAPPPRREAAGTGMAKTAPILPGAHGRQESEPAPVVATQANAGRENYHAVEEEFLSLVETGEVVEEEEDEEDMEGMLSDDVEEGEEETPVAYNSTTAVEEGKEEMKGEEEVKEKRVENQEEMSKGEVKEKRVENQEEMSKGEEEGVEGEIGCDGSAESKASKAAFEEDELVVSPVTPPARPARFEPEEFADSPASEQPPLPEPAPVPMAAYPARASVVEKGEAGHAPPKPSLSSMAPLPLDALPQTESRRPSEASQHSSKASKSPLYEFIAAPAPVSPCAGQRASCRSSTGGLDYLIQSTDDDSNWLVKAGDGSPPRKDATEEAKERELLREMAQQHAREEMEEFELIEGIVSQKGCDVVFSPARGASEEPPDRSISAPLPPIGSDFGQLLRANLPSVDITPLLLLDDPTALLASLQLYRDDITEITAYGTDLTIPACEKLSDFLKDSKVVDLKLSDCNIGADEVKVLAAGVGQCRSLRKLVLDGNPLQAGGVNTLLRALPPKLGITDLSLSFCSLDSRAVQPVGMVVRKLPQLRHLRLNGNTFGAEGAVALNAVILANTQLRGVWLENAELAGSGLAKVMAKATTKVITEPVAGDLPSLPPGIRLCLCLYNSGLQAPNRRSSGEEAPSAKGASVANDTPLSRLAAVTGSARNFKRQ